VKRVFCMTASPRLQFDVKASVENIWLQLFHLFVELLSSFSRALIQYYVVLRILS
jgi:hypothetical protein